MMSSLKFTIAPYPPYSQDLALSAFWLFSKFSSDGYVVNDMCKQIRNQPETFIVNGMKKWIVCLENCVAVNRHYVEK